MLDSFLGQAAVYLAAAVVLVPIASRIGLGSVLGYLLAGVAIGPFVLGLASSDPHAVLQFAEFGVVMMLFLVGLELDPGRLWRLRGPVLGLGGMQVGGTALAVTPIAMFVGLPWQQALALGFGVAMSSTAIALQSLTEKGLLRSPAGQTSFAVLLFQDISVIPILALFPLLATLEIHGGEGGHPGASGWVHGLPAWQHALVVLVAVVGVVAIGRLVVGRLLRIVARSKVRELFTATSLLLVVAVALLMMSVGLSAALGTFLAGVVLANSEYRHELMADVEPFKALLLGLFFIAIGATIDFGLLLDSPGEIGALVAVVVAIKVAVLVAVARLGGLSAAEATVFAATLSQVGEFAFVLFSVGESGGVLPRAVTAPMTAVTAFSMAFTPILLTFCQRFVIPRLQRATEGDGRESDVMDEHDAVIVAGYGRFGQIVGRLLRSHKIPVTVLDVDSEQVDVLRKFGQKVFYGDASRIELLQAAGASTAKVLVVAVDDPEKAVEISRSVRRHFPHLEILARARGRTEAYDLMEVDVTGVYRETFDTAVRTGEDTLRLLGYPASVAHRMARTFRHHDERVLRELAQHRHEGDAFVSKVRERIAAFEQLMEQESQGPTLPEDDAWDSEVIREGVLAADAERR
jgi:monovalent cation:proton antiporter-2 (CPA2) family protein